MYSQVGHFLKLFLFCSFNKNRLPPVSSESPLRQANFKEISDQFAASLLDDRVPKVEVRDLAKSFFLPDLLVGLDKVLG